MNILMTWFSLCLTIIFFKTPREEEPLTMTLDEWKAMQIKKDQPKFNLRKAGEG